MVGRARMSADGEVNTGIAIVNTSDSPTLVEISASFWSGKLELNPGEHRAMFLDELAPLYSVKRLFVQRRAVKGVKEEDAAALDGPGLAGEFDRLIGAAPDEALTIAAWERRYAERVTNWLVDEAANAEPLATAQRYAAWATLSDEGRRKHRRGVLFKAELH